MTARNFLHAALTDQPLPVDPVTLPALAPTFGDLAKALHTRFPDSPARVSFDPDPQSTQLFGAFPTLLTPRAEAAGFTRDPDLAALIDGALTIPEDL